MASGELRGTSNLGKGQMVTAEGSAKNWDYGVVAGFFGGAGAAGRGYSDTPQGKVLTAAFLDSYNQMVKAVRNYQAQNVEGGLGNGGALKVN